MLLKNKDNSNAQQESHLTEILNMNRDLMTTYLLGAQLKERWCCNSELQAKNLWQVWWEQVNESGISRSRSSIESFVHIFMGSLLQQATR